MTRMQLMLRLHTVAMRIDVLLLVCCVFLKWGLGRLGLV